MSKTKSVSQAQNSINLDLLNNSTQKATVFIGQEETLDVALLNNTGGDITLNSGNDNPAKLEVFLPSFYSNADYQQMDISHKDWKLLPYQSGDSELQLQYVGAAKGKWDAGNSISFQITKAKSTANAASAGQAQINLSGMSGNNIPLQVLAGLNLSKAPIKGNPDLPLEVALNSKKIFVSTKAHPVSNNLLLNIKNTGKTSLYIGNNPRPDNAAVMVSFIYGNTAGALATDADKNNPQIGSAWNIHGKTSISAGNDWFVQNPQATGQFPTPYWTLAPTSTNKNIIGSGISANVTFDFSSIISLLIPGHTQMMVQFSNIPFDDTKNYNDKTFILDIVKEEPTPGILKFTPIGSAILSYEPGIVGANPMANMTWQVINVDYVQLSWRGWCGKTILLDSRKSSTDDPCDSKNTFGAIKINQEKFAVDLKKNFPKNVLMTLQAFDSNGKSVGSDQITFQFEQVITLIDYSINILAGLDDKSEVNVQASPAQLINQECILLESGSRIDSASSEQKGATVIDLYDFHDLITTGNITSAATFDGWKVQFNNNTELQYSFKKSGRIDTQFPACTFEAADTALFTSIGLLNNKGSKVQLVFNKDQKTLNILYIDLQTNNNYRTENGVNYTVSKNGFGLTFKDDTFEMATNGKGYYSGLDYDLKIALSINPTNFIYNLTGKATASNAEFNSEIDVIFTAQIAQKVAID